MRLRRSELSIPGSSEKMLAKGPGAGADLVFCDLEDSVAPSEKEAARDNVVRALTTQDWGRVTRAVRINSIETQWAHEDVISIVEGAREALDLIIVPKVKSARDVWWVDVLLTQLETRLGMSKRIALEVLIEEVEALQDAAAIARSSPRLEALIFGPGDFSGSQGVRLDLMRSYPGDIWHHARNTIVVAARAAGIDAIDGPYPNFRDADGYRGEATQACALGFVGKWAIHPSQVELANDVYSPTAEQVERARKMCEAYAKAEADGLGAVGVDGVMVDAATVRIQRVIVERAELIGM